jgi:hypothetical protein
MDRVGRDVRVAVLERDTDHNKVVDMVKVISDLLLSDPAGNTSHNEIPRCSTSDLVGDVRWHVELTVGPAKFKLGGNQHSTHVPLTRNTYTFSM